MRKPLIAIPLKPFGDAKGRLAGALPAGKRAFLGRALAQRTVALSVESGAATVVLAGSAEIAAWASRLGVAVAEDGGRGLNNAARLAVEHAGKERWIICHADLPLLTPFDLNRAVEAVTAGGSVIAPSSDGGTSLIGSAGGAIEFAYGPGSFRRHLARLAPRDVSVLVSTGLCLDVDTPEDLEASLGHPRGKWLRDVLDGYAEPS